jgi:hypothetical protein
MTPREIANSQAWAVFAQPGAVFVWIGQEPADEPADMGVEEAVERAARVVLGVGIGVVLDCEVCLSNGPELYRRCR